MKFLTIVVFALVLVSISATPEPGIKETWNNIKQYLSEKLDDETKDKIKKFFHAPAFKMGEKKLRECLPAALKDADYENCIVSVAQEAAKGLGQTLNKKVFYKDFSTRFVGKM